MLDSGVVGREILLQDAKALRNDGEKYHTAPASYTKVQNKGRPDKPYQKGIGVIDEESI